ncbi:MAG: hypothetical protein PHE83_08905 [Opitutaceae bacterium]|nr:hypothetical protein [Opitutaceae bacterium]
MKLSVFSPVMAGLIFLPSLFAQTAPQPEAGPGTGQTPPPQLYGRIVDDTYLSASGVFKVKIPVLPQLGGAISDTPNVVTFDDDFSTHTSIAAFPLSRQLKWEYETRGTKEFLIYFFTSFVMPDFVARYPNSTMEDEGAYLPKFQDGSMLIFSLLPGGSFFEQRMQLGSSPGPVIAKRGNLCFVKSNWVFVLSTELAERALQRSTYNKTVAEENAILRQRLLDLVGQMQFIPPPAEGGN